MAGQSEADRAGAAFAAALAGDGGSIVKSFESAKKRVNKFEQGRRRRRQKAKALRLWQN